MTATNHAVTGIAIAAIIHNPMALPIAFLAHFIEDMIPHSYLEIKEIWVDLLIGLLFTVGLTVYLKDHVSTWLVLSSAFLCASPDLVWGWRYLKFKDMKSLTSAKPISWFTQWHQKIQWSETRRGIFVELVWLAALTALIIKTK